LNNTNFRGDYPTPIFLNLINPNADERTSILDIYLDVITGLGFTRNPE
jgi:hypothetical protein